MRTTTLLQPFTGSTRIGDWLHHQLVDSRWTRLQAAVAFVKSSGVQHIYGDLSRFAARAHCELFVGVDMLGTSLEGINLLRQAIAPHGEIYICHNRASTFHPKLFVFSSNSEAAVCIGSGNLTQSGLFTNYEAAVTLDLDLRLSEDEATLRNIIQGLHVWRSQPENVCQTLTDGLLEYLITSGLVTPELRSGGDEGRARAGGDGNDHQFPFSPFPLPHYLPAEPIGPIQTAPPQLNLNQVISAASGPHRAFVMTLHQTDAGTGQTTTGSAKRSPEIFVPLAARDYDPEFWGWPTQFQSDPNTPGKMDRRNVWTLIGNQVLPINMMTWPIKHDFRLRSEALRSAGSPGDILVIERASGAPGYLYFAYAVSPADPRFHQFESLCTNSVRNSQKRWGYF